MDKEFFNASISVTMPAEFTVDNTTESRSSGILIRSAGTANDDYPGHYFHNHESTDL